MAFLWVGLAYFLTAVVAPLIILKLKGGNIAFWTFPTKGWQWSLIAGTLGAIGALGVLLAFGKMPSPAYVPVIMSVIFASPALRMCTHCKRNCEHDQRGKLASCETPFYSWNCDGCNRRILGYQACPETSKSAACCRVDKILRGKVLNERNLRRP